MEGLLLGVVFEIFGGLGPGVSNFCCREDFQQPPPFPFRGVFSLHSTIPQSSSPPLFFSFFFFFPFLRSLFSHHPHSFQTPLNPQQEFSLPGSPASSPLLQYQHHPFPPPSPFLPPFLFPFRFRRYRTLPASSPFPIIDYPHLPSLFPSPSSAIGGGAYDGKRSEKGGGGKWRDKKIQKRPGVIWARGVK